MHRTFFSPWQTAVFCLANPIVFCYTIDNPFWLRLSLNFPLCERNFSMKLCDIHLRDPFVFAENGVYYLYGTRRGEATYV